MFKKNQEKISKTKKSDIEITACNSLIAKPEPAHSSPTILISRRQFLTTASMATAGLIFTPLNGWTLNGAGRFGIGDLFQAFGKVLVYAFKQNILPGTVKGFGGLAEAALSQIKTGGFNWNFINQCFGNNDGFENLGKLMGLLGGKDNQYVNQATAWLIKQRERGINLISTADKIIVPFSGMLGVSTKADEVFKSLNEFIAATEKILPRPPRFNPKNSAEAETLDAEYKKWLKQIFFLARFDGNYQEIAQKTLEIPLIMNKSAEKPIFMETESGMFVLIDYIFNGFDKDKKTGLGEINALIVPPNKRREIVARMGRDPLTYFNSLENRKELVKAMLNNRGVESSPTFSFSFKPPT